MRGAYAGGCPRAQSRCTHAAGKHTRWSSRCSATAQQTLPYGGAIVTRLEGSTKIVRESGAHVIPLLGPGANEGPQPRLPFGASIECVQQTPRWNGAPSQLLASRSAPGAAVAPRPAAPPRQMLDVLYVLSGSGLVCSEDGTIRQLHSGDSLVTWHNTTELRPMSAHQPPPVVLRFHFPRGVLMLPPGAAAAHAPSHADLQVLIAESQGHSAGELTAQEATDMLSGVHQRAAAAIARLWQLPEPAGAAPAPPQRQAPWQAPRAQGWAAEEGGGRGARAERGAAAGGSGAGFTSSSSTAVMEAPVHRQEEAQHQRAGGAAANNAVPLLPWLKQRLTRSAAALAAAAPRPNLQPHPQQHVQQHTQQHTLQQGPREAASEQHSVASAAGAAVAAALPLPLLGALPSPLTSGCVLLQRALEDFKAFRFPRQTNRMAFVFDPAELGLSLSFGVEVFEPGHHTPLHIHKTAHELFFVLAGEGVAFCNGQRFAVRAGDCVVFPPLCVHGIDNAAGSKLYCLQLMTPNEEFVEYVRTGEAVGRLDDEDLCNLSARHC